MTTLTQDSPRRQLPARAELHALLDAPLSEIDFVLPGFKRGTVGGLISPGGVGKSYWALAAAVAIASGADWDLTGLTPRQGRVLLLSSEDPEDILAQRLQAMKSYRPGRLSLANLDYRNCLGLSVDLMSPHWYEQVRSSATGCRLVILDTLTRFHQLDENSASDMQALLGQLERLAKETDAAVLYLHHTSKASALGGQGALQQAARGSSVLVDNARWAAFLAVMTEGEARAAGVPADERLQYVRWNISKQNYGAPQPDRWYRRGEGGVLLPTVLKSSRAVSAVGSIPIQETEAADRPGKMGTHPPGEPVKSLLTETPGQGVLSLKTATNAYGGDW